MSIRKKALIFSFLFLTILTIVLIAVVEINLWKGFNVLEDLTITRAVERSGVGINDRLQRLQTSSRDWAEWTDTYDYVLGKNSEFIKNNISENQFMTLGLNYMVFLDSNNKVVYGKEFDLKDNKYIDLSDAFLSEILRILSRSESGLVSGTIELPNSDPIMLVIRPILKTDGSGPRAGTLIFGRKIDTEIIQAISQITSFDFSLFEISDINNPLFSENAIKNLKDQNIFIEKNNANTAYGYTYFSKDIDNNLVLRVAVPRDVYKNGITVSYNLVIGLSLAAIFAAFIFIYIINILVIKRIVFLVDKISDVESGKSKLSDMVISGNDEISFLAGKLKGALERSAEVEGRASFRSRELEQSQKAILNVLEDIETEKVKIESLAGDLEKFKLA
ncbi:MAG: CHASE4 domain-containing protein, partial [Minisyncoccota bacterium]